MTRLIWHTPPEFRTRIAAARRLDMRWYDPTSDDEDALGDGLGPFRGMVWSGLGMTAVLGSVAGWFWMFG